MERMNQPTLLSGIIYVFISTLTGPEANTAFH